MKDLRYIEMITMMITINIFLANLINYLLFLIKVKIEEEVSNYNEFSLIVEIGSCLGLWLGLCISSIYDLLVQLGHYIMDFGPLLP